MEEAQVVVGSPVSSSEGSGHEDARLSGEVTASQLRSAGEQSSVEDTGRTEEGETGQRDLSVAASSSVGNAEETSPIVEALQPEAPQAGKISPPPDASDEAESSKLETGIEEHRAEPEDQGSPAQTVLPTTTTFVPAVDPTNTVSSAALDNAISTQPLPPQDNNSENTNAAKSTGAELDYKQVETGSCVDALSTEPMTGVYQHRASDASSLASAADQPRPTTPVTTHIYGVVLVGFNHALGPIVDYSFPEHLKNDEDIAKSLPFLALPDGAHMHDEDYSCFHLSLPKISASTVYGIACVRQIRADELLRRPSDVTRSTVQKAVVVLANKPIFGPIRDKLGVITRAFFAQRDFEETEILQHFHYSLIHALQDQEQTDENAINMGMSVRELVWKFRMQTLTLFKLMLLQKRVMFYGLQVERLCTFQYALVSLVPLLLLHLEDAASPTLDSRGGSMDKATSLRSSDRRSLLRYLGLPLHLFGKGAFFQPYLPLQQMELLRSESYLVGATNSIFQSQRDCALDVVVNLETGNIEFLNPKVTSLVGLTAADRKWMDEIVRAVETSWNPADPHRPMDMGYKASDDWIRSKFEEYVTSVLSAVKFVDFLTRNQDMSILINPNDPSGLGSFNESWIAAFRRTPAYDLWNKHTDPVIFDLVEPKHPCEGQAHVIEDVGIRLANGLHDLHLDEKLGPTQEAISKGLATGSEGVWKLYSSVRSDLAKRQAEFRERREREESRKGNITPSDGEPSASASQKDEQQQHLFSDHVLAGAAEVGGRAANLASNLGSFLGSRIGKARGQPISPSPSQSAPATALGMSSESPPASARPSGESAAAQPRPSIFSSFRTPSGNSVQAAKSVDSPVIQASAAENSRSGFAVSLPSPPVSSFTSFFRRPSAAPLPPSTAEKEEEEEMVIVPVDVTNGRRSESELSADIIATSSV